MQTRLSHDAHEFQVGTGDVEVRVRRNFFTPTSANYTVNISDTHAPGSVVVSVEAIDGDTKPPYNSIRYTQSWVHLCELIFL